MSHVYFDGVEMGRKERFSLTCVKPDGTEKLVVLKIEAGLACIRGFLHISSNLSALWRVFCTKPDGLFHSQCGEGG